MLESVGYGALIALIGIVLTSAEFLIHKRAIRVALIIVAGSLVLLLGFKERTSLEEQSESLRSEFESLQRSLDESQSRLSKAAIRDIDQKDTLDKLRIENTKLLADVSYAQQSLNRTENASTEQQAFLERLNESLREKLELAQTERERMSAALSASRRDSEVMQEKIEDLNNQNFELAAQLERARIEQAEGFDRARIEATANEERRQLNEMRKSYCEQNLGVVMSTELASLGGRCCKGKWIPGSVCM